MAWGDADADGDLDLVLGCEGEAILLYLGEGGVLSNTFLTIAGYSGNVDNVVSDLAWGDADNDGDLDLVTVNNYEPISLYRNDGPGADGNPSLTQAWVAPLGDGSAYSIWSVAWGDMDGDGSLDIVTSDTAGPVRIYRNDPQSLTFTPAWSGDPADHSSGVSLGDMDGDGDLDLAVANNSLETGQPNRVYRNDSAGGPLSLSSVWTSPQSDMSWQVAWGDMEGDGDLDLAVGNSGQPNRVYRNDGPDAQQRPIFALAWSAADGELSTYSLAWGDVEGDGDLDLAVVGASGSFDGATERLYLSEAGALKTTASWSQASVSQSAVAWGDADGDGDLDLATASMGGRTRLYRNDYAPLSASPAWEAAGAPNDMAWGDVDGDGDLDLAAGSVGRPNQIFLNNAGLAALPAWSAPLSEHTAALAWGDVDGDGDLDLAVGNVGQPNRIYRNDGLDAQQRPRLSLAWSAAQPAQTHSLAWGDADGDGDLDLAFSGGYMYSRICSCAGLSAAALYRNDGGTLAGAPIWQRPQSEQIYSLAWGDVDGDGDLDLAVGAGHTSIDSQPLQLYHNDAGTLSAEPTWGVQSGRLRQGSGLGRQR